MVDQHVSPDIVQREDAEHQAAAWLARLDADPSADLISEFDAWKDKSRLNREAAERMEVLWFELDALSQVSTLSGTFNSPRADRLPIGRHLQIWGGRAIAAVAAIAIIAIASIAMLRQMGPPVPHAPRAAMVYKTALDEQRTIGLSDGSIIELNTNSKIEVRLRRDVREVRLVYGEAYFEVLHDRRWPFIVRSGPGTVRAVGTVFDVCMKGGDVRVILLRGMVWLKHVKTRWSASKAFAGIDAKAFLDARSGRPSQATITQGGIVRQEVSRRDAARELAWRFGAVDFSGEPLWKLVAALNRYNDVHIEIADPRLRKIRVSGHFNIRDVDSVLKALQASFGIRLEWRGSKHVLLTATKE